MREYKKKHIAAPEFDDIYTVKEWEFTIRNNMIWNDCGSGYWMKDGYVSDDEVFNSKKEDATHVLWFNK